MTGGYTELSPRLRKLHEQLSQEINLADAEVDLDAALVLENEGHPDPTDGLVDPNVLFDLLHAPLHGDPPDDVVSAVTLSAPFDSGQA